MKKLWIVLLVLAIGVCFSKGTFAGEHPAEHPVKRAEVKKKKGINKKELAQAIEAYVKKDARLRGGYFLVYDKKAKKPLVLKLVRVHKERLSRVADDVYFACADFKTPERKIYDLDIFMEGTEKENLKVTEISVHKEAGKPRYTWYEKGGIWRKKFLGKKERSKPRKKERSSEHPSEHPH